MADRKHPSRSSGDTPAPDAARSGHQRAQGDSASRGDAAGAPGEARDDPLARELQDEGRAGKGINQAGYLKDMEDGGDGK